MGPFSTTVGDQVGITGDVAHSLFFFLSNSLSFFFLISSHTQTHTQSLLHLVGWFIWLAVSLFSLTHTRCLFSFFFLISSSHTHTHTHTHVASLGWLVGSFGWLFPSLPPHTHTLSLLFWLCAPPAAACIGVPSAHTNTHTHTDRDGWLENTLAHKQLIMVMMA